MKEAEGELCQRKDSYPKNLLEVLFEKDRSSHLGLLAQGLIHNLNGPLQNITMLLELQQAWYRRMVDMIADRKNPYDDSRWEEVWEKGAKGFQRIIEQTELLVEMVRGLGFLVELEKNDTEIDPNLIIVKLTEALRCNLFFKHHVKLELKLDEKQPLVRVFPRHFIPAVMNIFQKAISTLQHSAEKRLIIETHYIDQEFRVIVKTTGTDTPPMPGQDTVTYPLSFENGSQALQLCENNTPVVVELFLAGELLKPYGGKVSLTRKAENDTRILLSIPTSLHSLAS